jgi:hypothetical protein
MLKRPISLCGLLLGLSALITGCDANPFWLALSITPTSLPNAVEGRMYVQELDSTGLSPETWRVTDGALPPGMVPNRTTGTISGVPTAAGTYNFTISVEDGSSPPRTGQRAYTLTVLPMLQLSSTVDPARLNMPYSFTLGLSGGVPPFIFSATGLPDGLTLDPATGAITGTPTMANLGAEVQITVVDSGDPVQTDSMTITLRVQPRGVAIQTTTLPNAQVGVEYLEQIVAILGLRPYEWAITSGALPGGFTLQSATGVVWGTPTQAGTFAFTAQVTDGDDPASTDSVELVITVVP